jgi:TetR/AcrR family transcriptional regulator, transcriptional repressor for nem operon
LGRNKAYQRDDVLEKAMQLFWLHGYDGISTQMLIDEMGINRKSVYAEFGSKLKLYHATLDRYLNHEVPKRFVALNAENAGLQQVFETLERFAGAVGRKGTEKGCMLCNAASETAHHDSVTRRFVDDYFTVIKSSFVNALAASVKKAELPDDFETERWSAALATTLIGMFVMIRSRVDGATLKAAADLAIAQLSSQQHSYAKKFDSPAET